MLDLDDLEAKAKAATPGPWEYSLAFEEVTPSTSGAPVAYTTADENGEFIAATNPATVLWLIRELREARAARATEIGGAEYE